MATATNLILLTTLLLTAFTQHVPSTQQHVHMDFQTFEPEVSDVPELSADEARMLIMYRNTTSQNVVVSSNTKGGSTVVSTGTKTSTSTSSGSSGTKTTTTTTTSSTTTPKTTTPTTTTPTTTTPKPTTPTTTTPTTTTPSVTTPSTTTPTTTTPTTTTPTTTTPSVTTPSTTTPSTTTPTTTTPTTTPTTTTPTITPTTTPSVTTPSTTTPTTTTPTTTTPSTTTTPGTSTPSTNGNTSNNVEVNPTTSTGSATPTTSNTSSTTTSSTNNANTPNTAVDTTNSNTSSTTTPTTTTNTVDTTTTANTNDSTSTSTTNTNTNNANTGTNTATTIINNTSTTTPAVNTSTTTTTASTDNTSATTPVVNTSTTNTTATTNNTSTTAPVTNTAPTTTTTTTNNTTSSSTNASTTGSTTNNTTTTNTVSDSATSTATPTITNNNIRIAVDYQHWTETKYASYVQKQLVPAVMSYFEAALKVKNPLASKIVSTSKTLCGFATPKILTTGGVDADLFIFFNNASNTYSSWVGATTICTVSSGVRRPMIVNIGLNLPYLALPSADSPLNHDLNINVLMHEVIHGLGLNGAVYNYFVDSNGKTLTNHVKSVTLSGTSRTVLDLPILTAKLRNYYGCSTIPGLFIENDGTSHPENRFFQWDIMASGGIIGSRISEINLAFLEGTGWYEVDYSYAEPYFFGQGQGCDFYGNGTTATKFSSEYCTGTGIGCTELGESGGYCVTTSALENYRVYTSQPLFNCENPSGVYYVPFAYKQVYGRGQGSKCFTGNLTTYSSATQASYCLKQTCEGTGVNTKLKVLWGTTTLTCTEEGPLSVSGFLGNFNCPDPLTYCNTVGKTFCRKNCLGRGKCVDGQCLCDAGFTGTDCGMTTDFQ